MKKYTRITLKERVAIDIYLRESFSYGEIAKRLNRSRSSISREVARCHIMGYYNAGCANAEADYAYYVRRSGPRKLEHNLRLREEVFRGLRKRWSPEQISKVLARDYRGDKSMQVSHETIYTYIYALPRGELRAELTRYLRQKQKYRRDKISSAVRRKKLPEMISIEERPKSVAHRSVAGHWEGDLIIGKGQKSAIGTLVERKTRTVLLVPLKARTAESVRRAFERAMKTIPQQMKLSLTYDQGSEMAEHRLFTKNTKMKVYFCHPASPWERGTCENTNGLIRDFFPKNTDFSNISKEDLRRVQDLLNERPRKALGYHTPKEAFKKEILKPAR